HSAAESGPPSRVLLRLDNGLRVDVVQVIVKGGRGDSQLACCIVEMDQAGVFGDRLALRPALYYPVQVGLEVVGNKTAEGTRKPTGLDTLTSQVGASTPPVIQG